MPDFTMSAADMRLLCVLLLLVLGGVSSASQKRKTDKQKHVDDYMAQSEQRQKIFSANKEHLDKTPDEKINDWTVHEDVDGSFYWFSRSHFRSIRKPPPGWTKDSKGKWKAPPIRRDEL